MDITTIVALSLQKEKELSATGPGKYVGPIGEEMEEAFGSALHEEKSI